MNVSRRLPALIVALVLGAVACSDGVGPTAETFDPDVAAADVEALDSLFASDLWTSFEVLGQLVPVGAPAAGAAFAVQQVAEVAMRPSAQARQRAAQSLAVSLMQSVPVIPAELWGTTFVLDPETLQYVASDRTGAPETGVRFILYAVNPVTHQPIPDVPIGHVDLIDLGSALEQGVSLRVVVVSNEVTHFDYTVTAIHQGEGTGTLDVAGTISDGETTLGFEIGVDAARTDVGQVTEVAFVLEVNARNFRAAGTIRSEESATSASHAVDMDIRIDEHLIAVTAEGNDDEISGEIHIDGTLFATISGDPEHPTILGPEGRELTEREAHALRRIVRVTEHVFHLIEHLLRPAERLLNLDHIGGR